MMKTWLCAMACAVSLSASLHAQDMSDMSAMFKVPEEMKMCSYLTGTWEGEETLYFYGSPTKAKVKLTIQPVLNGRFFEELHEYSEPADMKPMVGKLLTTYDASKKVWRGYWFDSAAPICIPMSGKMDANKIVMTSEPFEMDGFPGKILSRSTWTKVSDTESTFMMEVSGADAESKAKAKEMGAKSDWTKIIEGSYKKKS